MNCNAFELELNDFLDCRLEPSRHQAIREHVQRCAACRVRLEGAQTLLAALRTLPAPAAPAGLFERARARVAPAAALPPRRVWPRWAIGPALAATLALGVALGIFHAGDAGPPPLATVALQLERPETVRLRIRAPRDLQATTITLTLPKNVELVGYAGQRSLTWQADLRQGVNLLQLPLVAHGAPRGELVALLSQGQESRAVRVKLVLTSTGGVS